MKTWAKADQRLHWLMAVLFVWQFASRWIAAQLPVGHGAIFHLHGLHSVAGYVIFALGLWRIARRLRLGRPPFRTASRIEQFCAQLAHILLYLMMFMQPITGIIAAGHPLEPTTLTGRWLHVAGSWLILGLVSLHIAAALWHHVVKQDDTLERMTCH